MKNSFFAALVLGFFSMTALAANIVDVNNEDEYVFIRKHLGDAKNNVWLKAAGDFHLEENGKLSDPLSAASKIGENSTVFLPSGSFLHIETEPYSEIWIEGPAKFKFSKIQKDDVSLELYSGSLRYHKIFEDLLKVHILTPLWKGTFEDGDRMVSWDPGLVLLKIVNFEKEFKFKIEDREEVLGLGANTKASFQGRLEDGIIVYDILLKGEKVPRGTFSAVVPINAEEKKGLTVDAESKFQKSLQKIAKAVEKKVKAKAKKEAAKSAEVIAAKKKPVKGEVCTGPSAKFNDCAWRCVIAEGSKAKSKISGKETDPCKISQGYQCVRERCFADGAWGDRQILSSEAGALVCKSTAIVKPCDY